VACPAPQKVTFAEMRSSECGPRGRRQDNTPSKAYSERVRLTTRGGYDWTKRFPWIVETALKNRQRHFVIDGEAVILEVRANSIPRGAWTGPRSRALKHLRRADRILQK
jgi:hypothetical protein